MDPDTYGIRIRNTAVNDGFFMRHFAQLIFTECDGFFQLVLSPISACEVRRTAMMMPNSPMALPKISMMRILTKREELAASATAAPDPTCNKFSGLQTSVVEPLLFLRFQFQLLTSYGSGFDF
jgi:hypothetical protein